MPSTQKKCLNRIDRYTIMDNIAWTVDPIKFHKNVGAFMSSAYLGSHTVGRL